MKKTIFVILSLFMAISLFGMAMPVSAQIQEDDFCIKYTPQMAEDTFRYLEEFYVEKHPEMALLWTYGMEEDKRILTEHTNKVIEGCNTDTEKVQAIYSWIIENITYDRDNSSTYSFDVLYDGVGNCIGQAMLLRDMCRVAGIPAAWGDGFVGNMDEWRISDMRNAFEGHAWCFVYVDGEWSFYDTVYGVNGFTDPKQIAKSYFLDAVEGITPCYQENLPPFRVPNGCLVYRNGRFWIYTQEGPEPGDSVLGGTGFMVNAQLFLNADRLRENDGNDYLDDISKKDDMQIGELYRDGWFAYDYVHEEDGVTTYGLPLHIKYAYPNGILAGETIMEYNGQAYYMFQGLGYKLCADQKDLRIHAGRLFVQTGYKGKIFEFCNFDKLKDDPNKEIIWETLNPEIATMDDNFVVTSYKEGMAQFDYDIYTTRVTVLEPEILAMPDIMEEIRKECEAEGNQLIDGKIIERTLSAYGTITYYFMDDISRPTVFGKQNSDSGDSNEGDAPSVELNTDHIDSSLEKDILDSLQPEGVVSLPVTHGYNALSFRTELLNQAIDNAADMDIQFEDTIVFFDNQALQAIFNSELQNEKLTIECVPIQHSNLTAEQQKGLPSQGVMRILSLNLKNGDNYIRNFGDGKVIVSFPFEIEGGFTAQDYTVYYVSESGDLEVMPTSVSGGNLSFETNHFSDFVLVNTAVADEKPITQVWIAVVALAVVVVVAGVIIILGVRKRKAITNLEENDSRSDI